MSLKIVIRPVQEGDLPAILEIASKAGPGFNSLPNNSEVMKGKIILSRESFSEKNEPNERYYFFVMENLDNHEIIGTAGIESCIGHFWPLYKYKLSTLSQISYAINQSLEHQILYLVNDHEGATELGALYLKPSYRGEGRGSFLSRTRALFIAEFPKLFSHRVVADMRGPSNNDAISPFWEALGQPFFKMTYTEASYLKSIKGPQFLMDLAPRFPIYVDLLPEMAQKAIGKTHEKTTPALHVLEKEGFLFQNYIDIFDGGPMIEVYKEKLKTVRESQTAVVVACKKTIDSDHLMLLSNAQLAFRATLGMLETTEEGGIVLEEAVAERLNVSVGDRIRYCHFQ